MAKKNQAYEQIARHIFENLPQYMPYVRYAGVFLLGFVCGMLWSQSLQEEAAATTSSTRQETKSGDSSARITRSKSKSKETENSNRKQKSAGAAAKSETKSSAKPKTRKKANTAPGKLLEAPEDAFDPPESSEVP